MNYFIIINPNSGTKNSIHVFNSIVAPELKKRGHTFDSHFTEYQHHAEEIISKANLKDIDGILILGGDGTMHEAVNGLLKRDEIRDIPIGLLPAGSGNSLLHDIGKFDIKTTLNKILNHNTQTIDILKITSSDMIYYSINLVGWGMVNEIGILAEKMRWMGPIRYNVSSIIKIFTYKAKQAKVIIDEARFDKNFAFIIICNTIHIGKGMKMAPHAKLNDGKMDIILIEDNFNKLELLKLFPTLFAGEHIKNDKVNYLQANSLILKPNKDGILNIDGELVGRTPISIDVCRGAIKLLN